jgi:hypothetical protein
MGNARILNTSEQCNRLGDGATVSGLVRCRLYRVRKGVLRWKGARDDRAQFAGAPPSQWT